MTLTALHHVQLAMPPRRENEARAFYGELLGIPEVPKPANLAKRGGVWFEHGSLRVHLGIEEPFSPARKAHPAFLVSGLAMLTEKLTRAGVEIIRDEPLAGFDRIYVSDPFGNRIEIMEATD